MSGEVDDVGMFDIGPGLVVSVGVGYQRWMHRDDQERYHYMKVHRCEKGFHSSLKSDVGARCYAAALERKKGSYQSDDDDGRRGCSRCGTRTRFEGEGQIKPNETGLRNVGKLRQ